MQHSQSTHSGTFITAMCQWITGREVIAVLLITVIGINNMLDSERQRESMYTQCHDMKLH
jgi:hypothetical protein